MSNVFKVDDTTIRTLIYNLQMEVKSLRAEVEDLKKKQHHATIFGSYVGTNSPTLDLMVPRLYSGGEKPP